MSKVRVRFAPSPTGGLHLGGVRTVLFNYLFAKKHKGDFILRIEDTDQTRFVPGAEEYIFKCLEWCGLQPDESVHNGGAYGPYRQSERKEMYRQYAEQLIKDGYAYYAFDTPEELEAKRNEIPNFQYNQFYRNKLKNSLTLPEDDVAKLLSGGTPYTIRIKIPSDETTIVIPDIIRGDVSFDTQQVDDKVLLKADGMPTYHLAVVVDDHLMKITHAFRGEEWLPSAPVHVLLWKYLFGLDKMVKWAHLPLILKPDGNGKLSKRDGERLGFPVYAMDWKDSNTGDIIKGFKEIGFLPQSFNNLLAVLGWNDGTEQEIFTMEELIEKFSIERIHKAGAKFDFEKAKWFNHEWIKKLPAEDLKTEVEKIFINNGITISDDSYLIKVIELIKDRCTLLTDFYAQGSFFFATPTIYDDASVKPKWAADKKDFFETIAEQLQHTNEFTATIIETIFKEVAAVKNIKVGELQMLFRIMLVGSKTGPAVFVIAETIGKEETIKRIKLAVNHFETLNA
ncbi:glutamate--tRNA ligase [Ferruginibacter albus]|uniref:glutamate--tRNA ligase n=1 Tax=Ferruginibacter albus TaxID=2875540 RepID=UPI001CC706DA|nr:glutamate--tRNA ligase [Ferruginibacter albus]UAY52755.1 glutamate--tRNA ligase [Ferruginibacter albus]